MNRKRKHLDILFRRIQPELFIRGNITFTNPAKKKWTIGSDWISREIYRHYAYQEFPGFSVEEIDNMWQDMQSLMSNNGNGTQNIFCVLPNYTKDVLRIVNEVPICRAEKVLDWREISFSLGQDILTTAHLAWHDAKAKTTTSNFCWPSIIETDDCRLQNILKKGISENHFHLTGSTQVFSLSWMCLMNHPLHIRRFLSEPKISEQMQENLQNTVNMGAIDAHLSWEERLYKAAQLRSFLFLRVNNAAYVQADKIGFEVGDIFAEGNETIHQVEKNRFLFGASFPQVDGENVCLDYAISDSADPMFIKNNFRSLSGERKLLYRCFLECYKGNFSKKEQDLFYLYLLLKSQFRCELIQVNRRVGFHNFAIYQNRKSDFWGVFSEYWAESLRLSVMGSLSCGNIRSLEARIQPMDSLEKNITEIYQYDRLLHFASNEMLQLSKIIEQTANDPFFYVLHFIKQSYTISPEEKNAFSKVPRNAEVRQTARRQAEALAAAFSRNPYLCSRIRGIDASNFEILCRPEVFSSEFRFLRDDIPTNECRSRFLTHSKIMPKLSATYHVGEDFLDIINGLRAIDEAVFFLNLSRGDRIGHALALGINPEIHYRLKGYQISMTKQERLDDIIWLIFRGNEFGIEFPPELTSALEIEAMNLLEEVYGEWMQREHLSYTLQEYYQAWKLRGDDPDLYRTSIYRAPTSFDRYSRNQVIQENELEVYRTRKKICQLYYAYHFELSVKEAGMKITIYKPEDKYMEIVRVFQEKLQFWLAEMGIGIECNPTSNYLIGTFGRYENHPMFKFNGCGLEQDTKKTRRAAELSISINTDDQGVFDTSLENEYALIADALRKHKEDGNYIFTDKAIYSYLDYIRELGNLQIFPSSN